MGLTPYSHNGYRTPGNIGPPVVHSGRAEQQNVHDIAHLKSTCNSPPAIKKVLVTRAYKS